MTVLQNNFRPSSGNHLRPNLPLKLGLMVADACYSLAGQAHTCLAVLLTEEEHTITSRQVRRERREAERKNKKGEIKRLKPEGSADDSALLSEPKISNEAFVSRNAPSVRPLPQNATERGEINRQNAKHSNHPRSTTGKGNEPAVLSEAKTQTRRSSRNSLKHGLASGRLIIPGEDRAAFEALPNILLEAHQPANPSEELLVQQVAQSYWLEQRASRLQNECFTENDGDANRLSLFLRYQTTHNRAFHKALNTLFRLKQSRERQRPASRIGFVSQNSDFVRQNPPSGGFVSQNAGIAGEPGGFASQNGEAYSPAPHTKAA